MRHGLTERLESTLKTHYNAFMSEEIDHVEPMEGENFHVSLSWRIGMVLISFIFLIIGIGACWWKWKQESISISAIVIVIVSSICLVAFVVSLFMDFTLIVGGDRLQNVRNGKVVGQVLYSNIAQMTIGKTEGVQFLGITLSDPENADTFWEGQRAKWYATSRKAWGYDIYLTGGSDIPLETILERIKNSSTYHPSEKF